MKTIQIESGTHMGNGTPANEILRLGGVRRVHRGWYTVKYNGVLLDRTTVQSAKRNRQQW